MDSFTGELLFMANSAGRAFVILMDPIRLMYLAAGCVMGLVLGIVPGIGGLAGTAMLLPFTFNMDPYTAFALLLGLGSTTATGDPIPAILFGVPGGAASAATALDGFPMPKKGEAGRALSAAYMSLLMGGVFGAFRMFIALPILRPVMLFLGSPELLAFSVLGISMVAVLSGSAPLRGLTAGCLGIIIAMVGTDPQSGTLRWTFDSLYLWDGLPLTPLLLGVFALPELCDLLISRTAIAADTSVGNIYKGQIQGMKDCFREWWLIVRCSWIGGGIGSIPGISASVVDWLAYGHALKTEKGANLTFGKGDVRGVIASESSNNAKEGGALVPTVAFGVPGSATMAILLGDSIERYMFISIERYSFSWLARPVVAVLLAMAIIGVVRPFLADVRRQGGIGKLLTSFQAPTFRPQQLFTIFILAMIATLVVTALPWAFAAKLVPMIVGIIALLVAGISLFNELCRKPTAAVGASLIDQAQAEVEQTIHADDKIHMDLESDTAH